MLRSGLGLRVTCTMLEVAVPQTPVAVARNQVVALIEQYVYGVFVAPEILAHGPIPEVVLLCHWMLPEDPASDNVTHCDAHTLVGVTAAVPPAGAITVTVTKAGRPGQPLVVPETVYVVVMVGDTAIGEPLRFTGCQV
jgi:hypothetical protein